ncbi:MAG: NAD-dependent epimerase/dehydratase family protein [Candidatus Eremiobacteraeota bacterium]|nr:NAD-dependent epimerase/dehydratase family protein [Candidatus Eremiobacteraeota bacterium]
MAKRVVVTGVAGFIGSNLADAMLAAGHRVVGIDNLSYGVREQIPVGVDFRHVDIRNPGLAAHFDGADAIFHLAAKNCILDCQDDPLETADVNVTGTVNVFEAARRAGVNRIIYAESSSLYEGVNVFPTPEGAVAPESFYAVSKAAGMLFAEAYRRFAGMRTTGLRYFCVYGPRQDYRRSIPPVMSAFMLKLLRGERPAIYGSGDKRRDFVYVDDVNDFHLRCLDDPRTEGNVYNIGSGTNHSVAEIYRKIASLLDSQIEPEIRPDLPGEAQTTLADISAARKIGWNPSADMDEGLRRSIDFIKQHVLEAAV